MIVIVGIAWKQFAQTFLKSMAKEAVPVSRVVRYLRVEKISFRYAEMLRFYRTYAKVPEIKDRYKYIPKKYRIPEADILPAHPFQSKEYLYEGSIKIRIRETGYEAYVPARLSSDFHLTPLRAEEEMMAACRSEYDAYGIDIIGAEDIATFRGE